MAHSAGQITKDEEELLVLIGVDLGLAVERAALSDEKERAGKRFKELFEKAHDAIWLQDLDGKILDANQAATSLGHSLRKLWSWQEMYAVNFLPVSP